VSPSFHRVEQRHVAPDQPALLEAPHAREAWRRREVHRACELDVREAGVVLQPVEDPAVDGVDRLVRHDR
jgi:hypothetical protein